MVIKYIDNDYIINELGKTSWGDVEEPDFYIKMASERVKRLIFPSEQGNPNDISTYTEEQQAAIKLATAKYTFWYFDTNYDQTSGSVSVSFGGVSMSESKSYNGETVLPEVYDILQQANLIPTTETFAILNTPYQQDWNKPDEFKKLQQELEIQTNNNIRQDNEIRELQDRINQGLSYEGVSPIVVDNVLRTISINIDEFNRQNTAIPNREEVLNIVYASGMEWRADFPYKTGYITQRVTDGNKLLYFLALKDSLGIDPLSPEGAEYWQELETQEIDLNIIVEQLKPYINDLVSQTVPVEVEKQLNELPETDYVQEQIGQIFDFGNTNAEQNFKEFNDANNITGKENEYWEDVPDGATEIDLQKLIEINKVEYNNSTEAIFTEKKYGRQFTIYVDDAGGLNKINFIYKDEQERTTVATVGIDIQEQEQKVPGKFFNGKPVYIRHISLDKVSTNTILIHNVDKVVSSNCFATTGSYLGAPESHWQLPVYQYDRKRFLTINKISNNDLYFNMGSWGDTIDYFYGTIEYTKIGD